ncbi:hypothetical protein C8N46_108159 [Kordia periserrulae]|uniref:DUF2975 domain-containing protein n=1 Tax=Kordia periserrulae TaxID=701523 RepID=A0A2T6BUY2_9FLAO|nr:hypothetical protein [Kordia periserrulae]PTX59846.1 hypothetical protein C8N46_108159 [Kordia periserrulae]
MKNASEWILKAMRLVAWIVFVWMLVKAGAIIMSYGASINNPEGAKDLYRGLDLSRYYEASFFHYSVIVFYYILLFLLQAYMALFATRLLSESSLVNLQTEKVSSMLHNVSITALMALIVGIVHNIHVETIAKFAQITADTFSGEYLFMIGLVFAISLLFKKEIDKKTNT